MIEDELKKNIRSKSIVKTGVINKQRETPKRFITKFAPSIAIKKPKECKIKTDVKRKLDMPEIDDELSCATITRKYPKIVSIIS